MKIKKNENGFGLIETLLVIVIIGLIGGVSYYIYSNKNSEEETAQTSLQQDTKAEKTDSKTFEFKELGVSIQVSGTTENLEYDITPATALAPEIYSLTTDEVKTLHDKCVKENGYDTYEAYVMTISKHEGKYADDLKAAQEANDRPSFPTLLKQFDDYYISADSPTDDRHGACLDTANDIKYRALVANTIKSLLDSFKEAKETSS